MAASPTTAKTVTLTTLIPEGMPGPEHFSIVETPMPTEEDLGEGGLLLQVMAMSADPYLRGGLKSEAAGGPVPRPISGFVAGRVIASKKEGWVAGDFFGASLAFTTVQILNAEAAAKTLMWKLTGKVTEATISHGIGVLGMPGSTAYGGLIDVLRPSDPPAEGSGKAPEVIWVSGAAGAVGGMVGQIAKRVFGCTVVGSCGGPAKCALVKEKFGFDQVVDYKAVASASGGTGPSAEGLTAALKEVAPDGIDMYFENVGGAHFEAAMASLRPHGRVAVCGAISGYNNGEKVPDRFYSADLIYNFQRVEGFMCMPWLSGQKGKFLDDMSKWLEEGKIVVEETHFSGVEQWPHAFQSLFTGANTGKVVVDIA